MLTTTLVNSAGNRHIYEQKLRTTSTGDQKQAKQDACFACIYALVNTSKPDLATKNCLNSSNGPTIIDIATFRHLISLTNLTNTRKLKNLF